jgi:class 3 adenylate cyclase/tetratricopeptide (TPR) repeat protein
VNNETERRLVSVVFTDIEGYSTLTQEDEALALSYVSKYRQYVIKHTLAHDGEVIHFYGDGSLTIHTSAIHAVNCAVALQRDLRGGPVIPVRIGIHMGEVVRKDETVYGNAVNIASRIQELGPAGSILVSESISEQLSNQSDIKLNYVGQEIVKNISKPVKVFAVKHEDLVVPSLSEIHRRNKARKPAQILVILAIIIFLGTIIFNDSLTCSNLLSQTVREQRVVVNQFDNFTGDPTLDYISNRVTRYISRCLEEVENAKVISYDNLKKSKQYHRFGLISLQKAVDDVRADNVIEGSYVITNDSTLKFTSALVDGRTLEYIIHFPEVSSNIVEFDHAIEELGQRIAGYWQSKESRRLTIPLQDADNAFNEALRYWKSDYDKAIFYLERAISIDSSFMDAYYYLSDAYGNQWDANRNQWDYWRADSIIQLIETKFRIAEFTDRQLDNHHFYQAYINGESEKAFKAFREEYKKDQSEIFRNTSMSILSLQYVNEPDLCLEVLNEIPFDSIDFESNDHFLDRISMAAQASIALGNYEDAVRYANYYPSDDRYTNHYEIKARALAGVRDTSSINKLLRHVNITFGKEASRFVLYGLSKDYRRFGQNNLSRAYSIRALAAYESGSWITHGHLLLDLEHIDQGRVYFEALSKKYPETISVLSGLGRAYALSGQRDKVLDIISKMQELRPDRFDHGETYYQQCKMYTFLGDYDNALVKLNQAVNDGFLFTFRVVENDSDLMPLFGKSDFRKIVHPLVD